MQNQHSEYRECIGNYCLKQFVRVIKIEILVKIYLYEY